MADDHGIVRSGIKYLIMEHFPVESIHDAETGRDLARLAKQHQFHVILLDINMPDVDLATTIPWLRTVNPDAAVLVFSASSGEIYAARSLKLGASGYLQKSASDEEIVHAITQVLLGKKYISADVSDLLLRSDAEAKPENPFGKLSDREMTVALLLEKGLPLSEISDQLNIEYATCSTYKRRIFEKLEINSAVSLSRLMQLYKII